MAQPSNTYSVARIHALETKLMDKMKFERMLEAASADDVLKILGESGDYGIALSELKGPWEYENVLRSETGVLRDLLERVSPNREITDLFFLQYDANNIKVMLKSKILNRDFSAFLSPHGVVSLEILALAFKEDDMSYLPVFWQRAIREAHNVQEDKPDPQKMDVIIDRARYAETLRVAKLHGEKAVLDYFRRALDWINIKSFFRAHKADFSAQYFSGIFIPGGWIEERHFWKGYEEGMDSLQEALHQTIYADIFSETKTIYQENGHLCELEKKIDNEALSQMKKLAKDNYSGIEPVLGYILAKEYEAKAVRLIMVGKLNGLGKDIIKERLRDGYV